MRISTILYIVMCAFLFYSCGIPKDNTPYADDSTLVLKQNSNVITSTAKDSTHSDEPVLSGIPTDTSAYYSIDTKNAKPSQVVQFAKTLMGVPYKYASSDPTLGFDCSGFITYVFNRFGIRVPRSSVDFTNVGREVNLSKAKEGDLILFTGTDSTIRVVGHMGIVVENIDTLKFIHSSSGKANGVTITPLNKYYMGRFVKIVDIFKN